MEVTISHALDLHPTIFLQKCCESECSYDWTVCKQRTLGVPAHSTTVYSLRLYDSGFSSQIC